MAAEVVLEEGEGLGTVLPLLINQEQMEASAELEVMEAAEVGEVEEGTFILVAPIFQEQEVQEVLAVLEEEVEAAEMLGTLAKEIMVVMVQQEVMAEVEGVVAQKVLWALAVLTAMAALVALD